MSWQVAVLLVGVVAAALGAGAFFVFTNFVMPALASLSPAEGGSAMQAINRFAPNPTFVVVLLAPVFAGVPVVVAERSTLSATATWLALAGVALSAVSMAITMSGNVPRNNELDSHDAQTDTGATYWLRYLTSWTRFNTLRGVASTASTAAYAAALVGR